MIYYLVFAASPITVLPVPNLSLTKQQGVYRLLKERIMSLELAPGQRIVIDDLVRDLGVSAIPVREALWLLQAERLVEIRPHAGATVAPITWESIRQIFTILEGIESVAARRVAELDPPELVPQLEKLARLMDKAAGENDFEKWSAQNIGFHLAMARATEMPWLIEIMERALTGWDRIRRYFFRSSDNHPISGAQREHHAIVQALKKHDGEEAARLVGLHNERALQHYSKALHSR